MPARDLLTRRETLASAGLAGAGLLVAGWALLRDEEDGEGRRADAATPSCVLARETTEGPYYLDARDVRSNLRKGKAGVPLRLRITVVDAATCRPVPGALVEVWHADALGRYSGFDTEGTEGRRFCRGLQPTRASGLVEFGTIYPGYYEGRTTHVHVKVRTGRRREVHTGQLFFPDAAGDRVFALAPYRHTGHGRTRNADDGLYAEAGAGARLRLARRGTRLATSGYAGSIALGVDLS
jgi:protocatechuate 3,4-dioxygenase beta subunit